MYGQIYEQIDKAMSQIQSGQVQEGLELLQGMMNHAAGNPDLQLQMAHIFYELGHVDTALSLLKEIEPWMNEITTDMQLDIRMLRAEILMDMGNLDEAMDELVDCLELEPEAARAAVLLAEIYMMQNLPEVACRYLEDVLTREPEEHQVRSALVQIYLDMGDLEKVAMHMELLQGTEMEERLKVSKARLMSQCGRFEEAYGLFRNGWDQGLGEEALFGCASTALQLGCLEEAIAHARQLISLDPDHLGAYQVLGEACMRANRPDEARAALRSAFERNDQEESIVIKLISLAYEAGDRQEAMKYVDHLLKWNDEHEIAREWKERLAQE